jgi:hypothetical protein
VRPIVQASVVDQGSVERATVLIVRAWTETGPPCTLKIRMLTAPQADSPSMVVGVTTDIEQACSFLRDWLADLGSGRTPGDRTAGPDGDASVTT